MRKIIVAAAVLGTLAGTPHANAAPITLSETFTASGFAQAGAPTDPVTGSFSITFDSTGSSTGTVAISTNLSIPGQGSADYAFNSSVGLININFPGPSFGGSAGTDHYSLQIGQVFSSNPLFLSFSYSEVGLSSNYSTLTGTLTANVPMPEPASIGLLALVVASMIGLGLLSRSRSV